jgi:molybdopterin molybdotransferase
LKSLIAFEEARQTVLAQVSVLEPERVGLLDALGRVLAEDVSAPWPLPSFNNSAMDGYAVRAADCADSTALKIIDYVPAGGHATKSVLPGTAIKIMTGAPVPEGCDSIVPFEDADEAADAIRVRQPVTLHQHVRFAGEDVRDGDTILHSGTLVRPYEVNMLACCGLEQVAVTRTPAVSVVATGDELVDLGSVPDHGKIVNSNSWAMAAAILSVGARPVMGGIARDNVASHREKLSAGLQSDVLITCAGVSMGDRDLVRDVLQDLGVEILFWQVRMKPGRAMAFGVKDGKPVFALPGNPVSAMLTFEEFVAPALRKMMGHCKPVKPMLPAVLQNEVHKKPGDTRLVRVKLEFADGKYLARSAGNQETSRLKTLVEANAVAVLSGERDYFPAGEQVAVHLLDGVCI